MQRNLLLNISISEIQTLSVHIYYWKNTGIFQEPSKIYHWYHLPKISYTRFNIKTLRIFIGNLQVMGLLPNAQEKCRDFRAQNFAIAVSKENIAVILYGCPGLLCAKRLGLNFTKWKRRTAPSATETTIPREHRGLTFEKKNTFFLSLGTF